ncbi:MAG TPA: S8 family serine peptidase [Steroidobacteraceae bacterium]|nr:S8 family serine peptidase [Steroidobacteraceae bacterium]
MRRSIAMAALACTLLATPAFAGAARTTGSVQAERPARIDRTSALVELKGAPLVTYTATKPTPGKKVDFASAAVKSYRAQLAAQRNEFRQWLRANAPQARITSEFDVALNAVAVQLNGTSPATLRSAPQVLDVQYQGLYRPLAHDDPDLGLIHANQAWQLAPAGAELAGQGVKIAIVDSGIDIRHPCFDDTGYPEGNAPDNDGNGGTNDKVVHAEAFYNKLGKSGFGTADVSGHGTHVAGTAACNAHTSAWIDDPSNGPVDIPYAPSGVAPGAMLGNFNVFPGAIELARSEDILNALQRAYELGFDVANMSLGGGSNGVLDLLAKAVNRFDRGGMVIAIAAGNEGPGGETIESPGFAERAIAVGASSVGHFVGPPVTTADGGRFGALAGEFATVASPLAAPLEVVMAGPVNTATGIAMACTALTPGTLSGQIALISRGDCTFSTKIRNAEAAGAVAVLVVNNVAGDPIVMGSDDTPNQPSIPAYMVGLLDGEVLKTKDGVLTTISPHLEYFHNAANDNIVADFSSLGPTDVDFRVKPDVVAPGLSVLSSQPDEACEQTPCWAFFQGTSMATPHIAGSAAVVIDVHPDWTSADVRSAIVNTAARNVLKDTTTGESGVDDPNAVGAGLANLHYAVMASVSLDPVSLAFGGVPAGSGQSRSGQFMVKNLTDSTATFTFSIEDPAAGGVTYAVAPGSVTLGPGQTAMIDVSVNVPRGHPTPDDWAWLEVSVDGSEVAHAALYTRTR